MIFWGFVMLFIATTVVMIDYDFGIPIMRGDFYLYFQSFIVDVFGALAIVGVAWRPCGAGSCGRSNWSTPPKRRCILVVDLRDPRQRFSGRRLADRGHRRSVGRLVAVGQPGGRGVATADVGRDDDDGPSRHLVDAPAAGVRFLAWAPYTKMAHVLTSTAQYLHGPAGADRRHAAEDRFRKGREAGHQLAGRLHLEGPARFRRLHRVRPLHRGLSRESRGQVALAARHHSRPAAADARAGTRDFAQSFIGATPALSVEAMWECTTCGACVEACPVSIEQMPKIVDTRRYLVMEDAEFPDTMQQALTSLETRGHPFRGTAFSRVDWAQGLDDRDDGRSQGRRRAVVGRLRRGAGRAQSKSRARRWRNC